MQNDLLKSVGLPTTVGVMLMGLNMVSERWAASKVEPNQDIDIDIKLASCQENNSTQTNCLELESNEGLTELVSATNVHNYFPSELLLLSMIFVGVLIWFQKSENPYVTFLIVASVLGLIRGMQTLNVYAPLIYFVVIGVGFGVSSVFLRIRNSA